MTIANPLIEAIDVHRSFGRTPALQGALIEAVLPLVAAMIVAAGTAYGISVLTIK